MNEQKPINLEAPHKHSRAEMFQFMEDGRCPWCMQEYLNEQINGLHDKFAAVRTECARLRSAIEEISEMAKHRELDAHVRLRRILQIIAELHDKTVMNEGESA